MFHIAIYYTDVDGRVKHFYVDGALPAMSWVKQASRKASGQWFLLHCDESGKHYINTNRVIKISQKGESR